MSLCSSWRFSGSLSFNRCTRTGARAPEWLVQNKSRSPEYSWAASKLRESYFGLINVLQLQSHLASNRGACKQGITVLSSAMDGTGKCYWLDCALLNAFFPPLLLFSSASWIWFGSFTCPLHLHFPPHLFIYLLLAPESWEIIGSYLKVPAGENSYCVLASPTAWS